MSRGGAAGVHPELVEDVGDMGHDGARADAQGRGNLPIRFARCYQAQDLDFTGGQVQNGIAPDRIVAKGYGESKPIARNTNQDGTDNSAGRQKNRRTEFKILEVGVIPKSIQGDEPIDEEDKYFNEKN